MWNNGNDCGCLWIILIIILLCCCCGSGNSGYAGNSCTCHHTGRNNFGGCAGSNECCC